MATTDYRCRYGYGQGSSRDWAAKGVRLAGVECVVANSERIHRQNLVGMGALPMQFEAGTTRKTLNIDGTEVFDIEGEVSSGGEMTLVIHRQDGTVDNVPVILSP